MIYKDFLMYGIILIIVSKIKNKTIREPIGSPYSKKCKRRQFQKCLYYFDANKDVS